MCVCECRVLCSPSLLAPRSRPRMARREVRVRSGIHTSRMPRSRACLQANATRKPPGVENAANACEPPGPRGASDDIITPTQPITALSWPPPRVPRAAAHHHPTEPAASRASAASRRRRALIRRARARAWRVWRGWCFRHVQVVRYSGKTSAARPELASPREDDDEGNGTRSSPPARGRGGSCSFHGPQSRQLAPRRPMTEVARLSGNSRPPACRAHT